MSLVNTEGENKGSLWSLYPNSNEANPAVEGSRECLSKSLRDRTIVRNFEDWPCGFVLDNKSFLVFVLNSRIVDDDLARLIV